MEEFPGFRIAPNDAVATEKYAKMNGMKIYVSHSKDFDFLNELYKPIRASTLNNQHEFFLPHENDRAINTQEVIKKSNLILAEVSFPATGQGIELGWANLLHIPILCVSKEGNKISGSLKYITKDFITYTDAADLIAKLRERLS